MLNIVIPMAGKGSRFTEKGYKLPKPLIPIHGIPMIRIVIENLRPKTAHRFIFICLEDHLNKYNLANHLSVWAQGSEIIPLSQVTEGAACTVLMAKEKINNYDSLMIANSDQWVKININKYLEEFEQKQHDGFIMTMNANDPKWSFIGIQNGLVNQVVEKKIISTEATVGIYNFKHGCLFVEAAESMIKKNLRVNNEFYVAPVYNELIKKDKRVGYYNIGSERNGMYGLGIPEDLEWFEKQEVSKILVKGL